MKKILITDVAGFIGFNLAKKFIRNYKVIGVDNLNNSSSKTLKIMQKWLEENNH